MKKSKRIISNLLKFIPDKIYLKLAYRFKMHEKLNLKSPRSFNEKIQWLKLYDRKDIYSVMVDKYEVKKYISDLIGEDYIIKTYGIYNKFDDIDFSVLPDKFVIKCTHDSGSCIVVRNKKSINYKEIKKNIDFALKKGVFYYTREWPYKNVKPRIIIEELLEDPYQKSLTDYKFFCFNGEPKFLYVSMGLENHSTATISFLNTDWTMSKYERSDFSPLESLPPKPKNFEEMIAIAKKLSQNNLFLRVDLYEVNEKIYFSELTFYPWSGFRHFKNKEHDIEVGDMLILPFEEVKK